MKVISIRITLSAVMVFSFGFSLVKAEQCECAGLEEGIQIAINNTKGNCLACHSMPKFPQNVLPGDVGPPLQNIKSRFSREKLRAHIWDQTKFNGNTTMPPFGKHKILTEDEIDKVTDFIYGL